MQYQFMPDLSEDEFESLKSDIAARGVMVPVELDEAGAVLDGHHRVRACVELGLTDYPRIIRTGMSEDEKREHVLALNLERRHLSREQRAELVARLRAEGWSLRRIGEKLGVSHEAVRGDLADAGVNKLTPAAITGTDGKQYPAKRPVVTITPQETAQTLTMLQAVEEAAEADPERFGKLVEKMDRTGKVDGVFRAVQRELAPPPPPIPEGQFSVVYADPPWEYQNSGLAGAAEDHYSTMPTLDICALPIMERLSDNAVCFLWVTNPLLIDGLAVLSAWGFCTQVGTRILTADLRWQPAEELKQGDRLVAFEEHCNGCRRHLKWGTVLSAGIEPQECYEIELEDGRTLVATGEHGWLMRTSESGRESVMRWIRTQDIPKHLNHHARKCPLVLPEIVPVSEVDRSYEGGFLSAAFDAEGSLRGNHAAISFAQRPNALLSEVERMLALKGYAFGRYEYDSRSIPQVVLKGGSDQFFRFMASFRPPRLLENWLQSDVSRVSVYNRKSVAISSVRQVGIREVVTLMTDTGTYIAEGFGAHNTYKTNFVWVKDRECYGKLGFYNYGQHELLLIGARGSCLPVEGTLVPSVIAEAKREHSRKPEEARAIIESMYPDSVRVELFARDAERNGWTLWGNEVGKCK